MNIFVKISDNKVITLDVNAFDKVDVVKNKIKEKEGNFVNHSCLIFAGKELENDRTLNDYTVEKESILYLAPQPLEPMQTRGGEPFSDGTAVAVRNSKPGHGGEGGSDSGGSATAFRAARPKGPTGIGVSVGSADAYLHPRTTVGSSGILDSARAPASLDMRDRARYPGGRASKYEHWTSFANLVETDEGGRLR